MGKLIIIGALVTLLFMIVFKSIDPNISNGSNNTQVSYVTKDYITCTISGEVNRPGSYVLNNDATLLDLISNAGGLTSNADELAFSSSIFLEDGKTYYIAKKAITPDTCVIEKIDKINVNTASKEELMKINGIGASTAQAIIDYRNENGDFTCLEDLLKVSGIGNSTFEKIKDYVTLY